MSQKRIVINFQVVCAQAQGVPKVAYFRHWARKALFSFPSSVALTIRIVDMEESAKLNHQYRKKTGATNVLAFPFVAPEHIQGNLLGDIVICRQIIAQEAAEQGKELLAHWAHMVVHGILHLLGYDHQHQLEAQQMEDAERAILSEIGYPDPYEEIKINN